MTTIRCVPRKSVDQDFNTSAKMKRRRGPNLFVLLTAFLVVSLPPPGWAQFLFVTNNGAITIIQFTGPNNDVIIPSTTNGYPVNEIASYAFANQTNVTSVIIPPQRHQHW